ncbi:MAG: SDR family oxidoreductase [Phaeodactylibacter sp.]|nr:SDR family oxidoreductase [Phaeodactylibacter sp.]MCB9300300.1 SDR family oxidoreductase [Lewinellaceae bacterium]HQU60921.1 SDR family oxidoreductase [Saprospiraceae bacterium]
MPSTNLPLARQTAIVTGASSGIGKACAIALGQAGANVVLDYVGNPTGAEEAAAQIRASGGQAMTVACDVSQEDQVIALFQKAVAAFGTVDILINNAGLQKDSPFVDMSVADWDLVLNVNLKGQFLCAREAIREFIRRGPRPDVSVALGKIICMSSVHEIIPWAGHANYAASKGGVDLLMKSIAQEHGHLKVRVNSIAPGAIKTPINHEAWDSPKAEKHLLQLIPYKRVGLPEDIGKLAVFLCSDDSDYIHGETIFIDGGMTLYPGFEDNG